MIVKLALVIIVFWITGPWLLSPVHQISFIVVPKEITDLMLELYGGGSKKKEKEKPELIEQGNLSNSSSPSVSYSPPVKKKVSIQSLDYIIMSHTKNIL